jgi:hypothetical protein
MLGAFAAGLGTVIAEASVQFRKALFKKSNIFRGRRLQLPEFVLVNMRDLSGFNGFEELDQSVSLFMPILRAHNRLQIALSIQEAGCSCQQWPENGS